MARVTCAGWTEPMLGDVPLSDMGWTVTAQDIPRASARTVAVDVPGRDGYADATSRPGGRARMAPLEGGLTLVRLGADEDEVEAALAWLWESAGREVWYTPWDRGGLRYRCLWAPKVAERSCLRAVVSVALTCQPAAYGPERSAALSSGQNRLLVRGGHLAEPVVELTASGGPVQASVASTGDSVRLLDAPAAGSKVVLDCRLMTATVGGEPARVTLLSSWLRLPPGEQAVAVAGGSGSIRYDERWL